MKYLVKLFILSILLSPLSSCDNFDDINTNPDKPTQASPGMLATKILLDITKTGGAKNFLYHSMGSKQIAWGEGAESYQYNLFDRAGFDDYTKLTNGVKMVEQATEAEKEAYTGLAKFVKAYKLFYHSLEVGDIPYKDILKGEEGILSPVYDTQKEVMLQILDDLDQSYNHFNAASSFKGDPILKGDPEKWRKTVTAFKLKVLMHLSKKEADSDLRVKERFAQTVGNGSLMTSNADNFQLVYENKANQVYPFHYSQTKHYAYLMVSTTVVDLLKEYEDYRLFYYANPAKAKIDAGIAEDSYDAYIGVDPSDPINIVIDHFNTGEFCGMNDRYTQLPEGEPLMRISYGEQNFILAEAVTRGWITGDASAYYKKGIEASFRFIDDATPDNNSYHHGRKITDEVIAATLNNSKIQLAGNKEADIEKILTQRYLASYLQHPWDAYYDYRRTGYPVLPINPNTNQNTVKDKLPLRWMYPQVEYDYNSENVTAAVARQFGGVDDVNKPMWILE